jgi:thioesterase domain-containing protein
MAFQMARKLRDEGDEVNLLAMIDPPGPRQVAVAFPEVDDVRILTLFAFEAGLIVDTERLRRVAGDERLAYMVEQAIAAGMVPPDAGLATGVEYLRRCLRVFKAGSEAAQRYIPGPYSGRIDILCAAEMPNGEPKPQDDGGWSRCCSVPIVVHSVPGNHQTVLREPNVGRVAEVLHGLIARAAGGALQ